MIREPLITGVGQSSGRVIYGLTFCPVGIAKTMNKILEGFLVFVGIVILFLGIIFVVAGGIENTLTGAVMILVAVGIFAFTYYTEKIQATKPTLVSQTFNVKMEGSGKLDEKEMKCRTCGAPITEKDLKIVQGGVMVTCSYCGAAYSLEEEPKW